MPGPATPPPLVHDRVVAERPAPRAAAQRPNVSRGHVAPPDMTRILKRWLYLVHRWFGIGMSLLVALWFASGIVMMYVEYPELTETERLNSLRPIDWSRVAVTASEAATAIGAKDDRLAALRLTTVLGRPAYQLVDSGGRIDTVFADDGTTLAPGLSPAQAETAVKQSGFHRDELTPVRTRIVDIDQWTVSEVLSRHRPLHKVELGDRAGTTLYVSDMTGQIVRDTNRAERLWNWVGSTLHWIYPWQLRQHAGLWADIIIYLALAGLVSIVSGGLVGWWRLRLRRRYRGHTVTPYRGMHRWHHLLGLGSFVFLGTFMVSGLLSMGPWNVFSNASSATGPLGRYTGGAVKTLAEYPTLALASGAEGVKEIEWLRLAAEPYLLLSRAADDHFVIHDERTLGPAEVRGAIENAVPRLLPDASLLTVETLTRYDDFYYTHHNRYRPLPVLRAIFDDDEHSWFHIDLDTGRAVNRLTRTDRTARWLYNGLHSLDFAVLFQRRPLWDVVVITLCLAGLVFSMTSVWIGWRRLWH
jgi:hypothetical protein